MVPRTGIFLDRCVIGSIPDYLQDKRYCYRYLRCFISIYFNVNDELEAAAWHFSSLSDVTDVCSTCVWLFMRICGVCVCICVQSVVARVKRSKVWVQITRLSDTSVRCNMCSSVIVNQGGNIMKHLLTTLKQSTSSNSLYLLCLPAPAPTATRETHSHQMLFSGRVTLTRHLFAITKVHYLRVLSSLAC